MGGPLSLLARNRLKYRESFLGPKKFRDFDYLVDETQDEMENELYVLTFRTTITKQMLDELEQSKNRKQWKKANKHKLLQGKLYINPKDYAVVKFEASVPNELKKYFCGYTVMAIKHFDYKLDAEFKKENGKYTIDYLRHEDEFIFKDTTDQTTTPYAAISEFHRLETQYTNVEPFSRADRFENVNNNQLYDYALAHDSLFWKEYTAQHPIATIDSSIRKDMEGEKTMEGQFTAKQTRDLNLLPPVAQKKPSSIKIHGEKLIDPYQWLKEPKSPRNNKAVFDYLSAENEYTDNYFIPLRKLQRELFAALSSRVEEEYTSLPTRDNGYYYHLEYKKEDQYPIFYRKAIQDSTQKELLLDVNIMAKDQDYYDAGGINVSPNNQMMAYYENTTGSDRYVLKFKDLTTGALFPDSLIHIANMVWIDNQTLLYTSIDPTTLRSNKILRHKLGTPQKEDAVVFEEADARFEVACYKSKSKEFIFLSSGSTNSSETYYLRTDQPYGDFKLFSPRVENHLYSISHYKDQFYIISNKNAINYQILKTDTSNIEPSNWKTVISPRKDVLIEDFLIFDQYFVLNEKANAQNRLRVIHRQTKEEHYIKCKEEYYDIDIGYNPDTDTKILRYSYSSFVTPSQIIDYNMDTKYQKVIKKGKKSIYYYSKFKIERTYATAPDGTQIPITLVYNKWRSKGTKSIHKRVYLTSYGSYGSGSTPGFSHYVHALLQRGFVFAIAHVRGGNDMGMQWYHDGRMLNKKNTFTDFIACAEHLIQEGYAAKGTITAQGGSAGGLLMGAIANMRPDLFKAIILDVPFVDVINTMLDDKLPLTTSEYEEWGNPSKKKYFDYIKSYSPYENVKAQDYPHLFFFTGINDTRVGYWEPAKMVAKLRDLKTDDNILLLKTDFYAGHGGGSGRYAGIKDAAYKLAIIFDLYKDDLNTE